jgi:hypothetical protein
MKYAIDNRSLGDFFTTKSSCLSTMMNGKGLKIVAKKSFALGWISDKSDL